MEKEELSKVLTSRIGKEVIVTDIQLVGSGYHSEGYKIITKDGNCYFVKKIKSEDLGFEFPERKVNSLLVSHGMLKRHMNSHPNSIGIAIKNQSLKFLPEINDKTEVYHFQEYGGEGKNYLEILNSKQNKNELDSIDKEEIEQLVDFVAKIHSVKHPSQDKRKLTAVYNDWLRSVIGHPEYLLQLLHAIGEDSPALKPKDQGKYLALMLENMHYFKNKPERVVALHGDFWGANAFFRQDGTLFMIDYSRMPWGDAGFDIGFWISVYLMGYHKDKERSKYFRKLGEYFLDKYIEKTGDKEVLNTMVYSLGLVAAMYASPTWVPGIDSDVRIKYFNHVCEMLKRKEFFWD